MKELLLMVKRWVFLNIMILLHRNILQSQKSFQKNQIQPQ